MAKKIKKGDGVKKYLNGGMIDQEPVVTNTGQEPTLASDEAKRRAALVYNQNAFREEVAKRDKLKLTGKGHTKVPGVISDNVIPLVNSLQQQQAVLNAYQDKNKLKSLTKAQVDAVLKAEKIGDAETFFSYVNDYNLYRGKTPKAGVAPSEAIRIYSTDYNPNSGGGIKFEQEPVYDENLRNIFVPEKKSKGGGIKGYLAGGDIREDQPIQGKKKRSYSNKPLDYVHDTGLAIADYTVGHVSPNLIKDKDYKTKTGAQANQVSYGVNKIGGAIGQGIVDYYIPGLGSAIGAGRGAIAGEDEGLDEKDTAKQNAVAGKIGIVGQAIAGGAGAIKKKKGDETQSVSETPTFEQQVDADIEAGTFEMPQSTDTTNLGFYDGKNLDKELTAKQKFEWANLSEQEKAEYAQNGFQSLAKGGNISPQKAKKILHDKEIKGKPLTEKQRKLFGAKSNMAEGGEIEGPGTETSDSIPAKMEEGGFIVPAKNAAIAEELRKKYLGESKTAPLTKGDTKIKVSDGEHYFTQDEADFLRAKGINLDSLAPEADGSEEMADGGPIEDVKKKKVLELQREIVAAEKEIKEFEKLGGVNGAAAIKNAKARIANLEKLSRKAMQDDAYSKDSISGKYFYDEDKAEKLSESPKKKESQVDLSNKIPAYAPKSVDPILSRAEKAKGVSVTPSAKTVKQGSGIQRKLASSTPQEIESSSMLKEDTKTNPLFWQQSVADSQIKEGQVPTGTVSEIESSSDILNDTPNTDFWKKGTSPKTGSGIAKNFDLGTAFSAYQVGQGLKSLKDAGSRPIDQIDSDFASTVERAKVDALGGMSPVERAIAERKIERNRRADVQNIIGLSGGSAGTALGNIGAAGMRADEANLNLSAASEALRLQKQAYADSLVGKKAGMSRQLFEDKLNAFNTNQVAGAGLLGAGIQNLIGGDRYRKALEAEEEAKKIGNYQYIS